MKRTMITALGIQLFAACATANAASVYLDCELDNPGGADAEHKVLHIKVALDEAAKTADFQNSLTLGKSVSLQAQFMQTEVTFKYVLSGPLSWDYKIDRTTLAITEKQSTGSVRKGICKVAAPVERKF